MKKAIFFLHCIVFCFLFSSCKDDDFETADIVLPTPVGTDIFSGNTYDLTNDAYSHQQYIFHSDNTVDYYYYSIMNNEKTLWSQIHYKYSYNADTQLLYLFSQSLISTNISDNEVYRDINEKRNRALITIYFCTKNDDGIQLAVYFAGDINRTQTFFQYDDSDIHLILSPRYDISCRNKSTNQGNGFRGIPVFSDEGTVTIREYKNRKFDIGRQENGTESKWVNDYPIYTANIIKGTYSFPNAGTDTIGTITFTEVPEVIETNWGIKANTTYTFSQVKLTYTLTKTE